ncbi:DASH complex subunit ask1 [Coemansia sp. RSA 1813]|nr:DASH complex subunit ask1 [Coemansia sp. RSA 1646]KAJ1771014.1 DASH complex subunit ask1 [Coemansia sp. RSA 1843]KAJ2089254.1 DASH complex subunit ask1 [Coemansia sp. RSA 986]KAJ2215083.1 DASH complex subunit ask1 [Coemansia sp. RSA 487]KAJ2569024.1 DASH complex subunit ask1 [Coemansia sp. RSA 1813]
MSHYGKHKQLLLSRPDSRASVSSTSSGIGGGRFTNALSAAIKREEYGRPPLPPTATASQPRNNSPDEQLEEVEQKITLTLQAIDANFDHCQRTMARDVMPKIEKLAKLSSELLEASQPWLQFFMAVAASDEQIDDEDGSVGTAHGNANTYAHDNGYGGEALDSDETRQMPLGLAQRAALEEQAYKGDITARFPSDPTNDHRAAGGDGNDDNESVIDIDAEIDSPQLTSRFLTEEFRIGSAREASANIKYESSVLPSTPRARNLKRMAEQLSVSAKKRRLGTPGKDVRYESGTPRTPLSMMRALVNPKSSARSSRYGGVPGSAMSFASNNTSSMGTVDLMPDTSPPHTTTFVLPKSRRIAPARGIGSVPASSSKYNNAQPEHADVDDVDDVDDNDDDILDEINTLIKRYDSPKVQAAPDTVAKSRVATSASANASASASASAGAKSSKGKQPVSVAKSDISSSVGGHIDESEMNALANKYASPTTEPKPDEVARVKNLVADMEELLDEVEAIGDANTKKTKDAGEVKLEQEETNLSADNIDQPNDEQDELDDLDDDIPSPPKLTTDLERSPVIVSDISGASNNNNTTADRIHTTTATTTTAAAVPAATTSTTAAAATIATRAIGATTRAGGIQPRRTFGAGRNMIRMDVEEMDNENMTIGHMSPLAIRSRQTMLARNQGNGDQPTTTAPAPAAASTTLQFHALNPNGLCDEDDPFGPTPQRNASRPAAQHIIDGMGDRHRLAPSSVQSEQQGGAVSGAGYPSSSQSWDNRVLGSSRERQASSRSNTVLGSDATATYDTSGMGLLGGEHGMHTTDSRLNESSITIDHNDYESFGQASIDGTTTILPTREMLQRAAQVAEGSVADHQSDLDDVQQQQPSSRRHSVMDEGEDDDEEDMTRNSAMSVTASSFSETGALVTTFSVDMFPPAFREPPASLQLRALYDLVKTQDQRIWTLDDLMAAAGSAEDGLRGANASMFTVLLDLLSRRRLIRKVSDSLWSAH